jgi:hypothetical protein
MSEFNFCGRADGIGNRVEQLIAITKYCEKYNTKCVYKWNNSPYRTYPVEIKFKNIEIKCADKKGVDEKGADIKGADKKCADKKGADKKCADKKGADEKGADEKGADEKGADEKGADEKGADEKSVTLSEMNSVISPYNTSSHQFLFHIDVEEYDTAIHIRAGDRILLTQKLNSDFSTLAELDECLLKTIKYVNETESIKKCIILCEEKQYIEKIKNLIIKKVYELPKSKVHKDWQDFYYLTKAKENIIMCCKFSSFSVCAAILANLNLVTFFNKTESNLARYNVNKLIYV